MDEDLVEPCIREVALLGGRGFSVLRRARFFLALVSKNCRRGFLCFEGILMSLNGIRIRSDSPLQVALYGGAGVWGKNGFSVFLLR